MAIDRNAVTAAVTAFFSGERPVCPNSSRMYKLSEAYGTNPYWVDSVRAERFKGTLQRGFLYRPAIADDLCNCIQDALNSSVREGVMVKGPHGIGKSHSLVNTVLKLESAGHHLVTFIPDCAVWTNARFLIDYICKSFWSSPEALSIDYDNHTDYSLLLENLVTAVDAALSGLGKRWVFVFDQINKLFVKQENKGAEDATGLAFPYHYIYTLLKPGRITCVIAASANNEMAYKERHEGFTPFPHNTKMEDPELESLFDGADLDVACSYTGGVPLYTARYVSGEAGFQAYVDNSVSHSLEGLQKQKFQWKTTQDSIISCLLLLDTDADKYDKKFLLQEKVPGGRVLYRYKMLLPAVSESYKRLLWDDLLTFVEEKEATLISVCKDPSTTNDTRGRLFEHMVIQRCNSRGVDIQVEGVQVNIESGRIKRFNGKMLPRLSPQSLNAVYVPIDPNFTAVDLVWKFDKIVIGVQCHVNDHDPVASPFWGLCKQANWFKEFDHVQLIYLSPEEDVSNLVQNLVAGGTFIGMSTQSNLADPDNYKSISLRRIDRTSVPGLSDMLWPEGCSIRANQA